MYRRAILICLVTISFVSIVVDANACHRCRSRRGYGYYGCGYGGYGHHGYRVAKVYRTVRVPVQTCSCACVATCDPCGNMTYASTPTCTTTYVTQRVLVHTQVVGRGPVYGNYLDGSHRQVAGPGYGYSGHGYGGYRSPYRTGYGVGYGYGLGGGYRMGGYGAAKESDLYVARYQLIDSDEKATSSRVGFAF